jgi:hypothetical protein
MHHSEHKPVVAFVLKSFLMLLKVSADGISDGFHVKKEQVTLLCLASVETLTFCP